MNNTQPYSTNLHKPISMNAPIFTACRHYHKTVITLIPYKQRPVKTRLSNLTGYLTRCISSRIIVTCLSVRIMTYCCHKLFLVMVDNQCIKSHTEKRNKYRGNGFCRQSGTLCMYLNSIKVADAYGRPDGMNCGLQSSLYLPNTKDAMNERKQG